MQKALCGPHAWNKVAGDAREVLRVASQASSNIRVSTVQLEHPRVCSWSRQLAMLRTSAGLGSHLLCKEPLQKQSARSKCLCGTTASPAEGRSRRTSLTAASRIWNGLPGTLGVRASHSSPVLSCRPTFGQKMRSDISSVPAASPAAVMHTVIAKSSRCLTTMADMM